MATVKKTNATKDVERVDVFVPRSGGDAHVFIGVNGVNYVLPKGKTSNVPKHIAEEFYRSQKAEDAYEAKRSAMLNANK